MVNRNNAGRLGAGVISVCLETRWLGQKRGFYVPDATADVWQPKKKKREMMGVKSGYNLWSDLFVARLAEAPLLAARPNSGIDKSVVGQSAISRT